MKIEDHFRDAFNQKYLVIDLEHHGNQCRVSGHGAADQLSEENGASIRQHIHRHPGQPPVPDRAQNEKAHFFGTMNAKIDAAGSGQYAELDDQGRYKVILPFDLSGRENGKASTFLRMMQPYAGSNHGMHFPLHKGTEVLLTFIDGDPDRPVIAGAVPNPDHPSLLKDENQSMAVITPRPEPHPHGGQGRPAAHPSSQPLVRLLCPDRGTQ